MRKLFLFLILSLALSPPQALACSDRFAPTFREELKTAKNIFVFRLVTTKLVRKDGYSWAEGDIEILQVMKGRAKNFRHIKFSTLSCGANNFHVGHEYLGLNSQDGLTFNVVRASEAVIDLDGYYSPEWKDPVADSFILKPVNDYIKGKPLPSGFPDRSIVSRTSFFPSAAKQTKTRSKP